MAAFEEMGLLPEIATALDEYGWTLPTDVQAEAIPLILGGGDVIMAAETGSGKTGAFCLPVIQIVWETLKDLESGKVATSTATQSESSTHWALSLFDRNAATVVTPDGLRCQSREQKEWQGCRATKGVQGSNKFFFEATVTDEGLCRVGWSTSQATLDLGTDKFSYGFGGTGKKSTGKQFSDYGEPFGKRDVIGCYLNLVKGEISYTKNGVNLGTAFTLNAQQKSEIYFPAVVLKNAEMSFNFGAQPFKYPPSDDFIALVSASKEFVKENPNNSSNVKSKDSGKPKNNAPQAIIIEPSKELAKQISTEIERFKKYLKDPVVKELLATGGIKMEGLTSALNSGVDIIVGTLGRLTELIKGGYLSLSNCRFFILDEADALLVSDSTKAIDMIYKQIPKITSDGKRLQMIVCSATLHSFQVKNMADKLMHFPIWVDLKGEDSVPETVHHIVVPVDPSKEKKSYSFDGMHDGVHANDAIRAGDTSPEALSRAVKFLKQDYCLRVIREYNLKKALIFCRTKLDCDILADYLNKSSYTKEYCSVCLHGDKSYKERANNLKMFMDGTAYYLICTDVAARGLDVKGLPYLINMMLPDNVENYVHRIGRVGRADRMGLAISLVSTVPEKVWYHGEWCPSRGRSCKNTNLTESGGCCIWFNEQNQLAEIEDHLKVTIPQVDSSLKSIPINVFDGTVSYGEKKVNRGPTYDNHVQEIAPYVSELSHLESKSQLLYLKRHFTPATN